MAGLDLARAAEAAGALALRVEPGSGRLELSGPVEGFGLCGVQRRGRLSELRDQIAATDRVALDGLSGPGRLDVRLRLVGEDQHVRHVRLTGAGDGRVWTGLLLPAGAGPDGGQARLAREAALTRDLAAGRILAFHQPIVDLSSGCLAGFEALARWQKPGEGLIGPDDFLPLAAEMGLTTAIGEQVRAAAIADLAAWRGAMGAARRLTVAANATASELLAPDFADTLIAAVKAADLPPGAFKLEINETEMMREPEAVTGVCARLKRAGIALVLDDFGTGYSSLARLDRLPFDTVKIDQYFIRAMSADPGARAIVSSVVKIARNYAMTIVAEGVETAEMARLAAAQGCDFAQGFAYAGALPPDEAARVIETGREGRFAVPAG